MRKHAIRLFRNIGKKIWVLLLILFLSGIPSIIVILYESLVEEILLSFGISARTIIVFIQNNPILLPCIAISLYFLWAINQTIQDHFRWMDIRFVPVTDFELHNRSSGLKISNQKEKNVDELKAEVITIYQLVEGNSQDNGSSRARLPLTLGWINDGSITFENQILGRGRELYLVLTQTNGHNYEHGFMIRGKRHYLVFHFISQYLVRVRLSGGIENKPMPPKLLDVVLELTDQKTNKLRVVKISEI